MGTLSFHKGKFYFDQSCDSESRARAESGLLWDAEALRWATRSADKALKLRRFADDSAERKFKTTFITKLQPPEWIEYPDHLEPKLFQIESAWHALSRTPAYVADEAGLGKTITSILCINSAPGPTLIVCPPFLKYNWLAELKKWLTGGSSIALIEEGKDFDRKATLNADVTVLPDSLLAKAGLDDHFKSRAFKWAFFDESHRFKEEKAQRTLAAIGDNHRDGIAAQAERVVLLSGTPIPNGRPIELYPLLARLAPAAIGNRSALAFGKRFCNGHEVVRHEGRRVVVNWDFRGASNLKQLRKELRAELMIRHLKRDVLTELEPKTRKIIFLDRPSRLNNFEKRILKDYSLDELMTSHGLGDIAKYRREIGVAKIKPALEILIDHLENNPGKVVVFAHHIEVVERLTDGLVDYAPLMIRGGMTAKEKAERVRLFQTVNAHRVVVGNIDAIGIGNTLTAAPDGFFVEWSWQPGANEQAEDRLHRMTQAYNCYFRYLTMRGSLDERMLYSVLDKQENTDEVMA